MPVFVSAAVASIGIGMYAVAALLWDRRRQPRRGQPVGRASADTSVRPVRVSSPVFGLLIMGCLVLGTALVVGACMGLFKF